MQNQQQKKPAVIAVGTRVSTNLYNYGPGVVVAVQDCNQGNVRHLGGGLVSMGGGKVDIIFHSGEQSKALPECILRGVQWQIRDDEPLADSAEIAGLKQKAADLVAENAIAAAQDKAAHDAAVARLKADPAYAHLSQGMGSAGTTDVAKNIRKDLKHHFSGVKFSVRCEGSSVYIKWDDGPTEAAVKEITFRYQGGHFDGMTDCYEYTSSPWTDIFGSVTYVFIDRSESDELIGQVISQLAEKYAGNLAGEAPPTPDQYRKGQLYNAHLPKITGQSWQELISETAGKLDARPPAATPAPAPAAAPAAKPAFKGRQVAPGIWQVTIELAGNSYTHDQIAADNMPAALAAAWAVQSATPTGEGWQLYREDGRIGVKFDGKPAAAIRDLCKAAGLRWAPSRTAWVRKDNAAGQAAVDNLISQLPG